jgi:hypothetical protein
MRLLPFGARGTAKRYITASEFFTRHPERYVSAWKYRVVFSTLRFWHDRCIQGRRSGLAAPHRQACIGETQDDGASQWTSNQY